MKSLAIFSLSIFLSLSCLAQQHITKADHRFLVKKEDSLKIYAMGIIGDSTDYGRFKSDSAFTKMFVRTLKIPNSFYYPYDSLLTISILYAPDSSFRIFTWQLVVNDNVRQHGAIQMRTSDGSLKLLPLIDKSEIIKDLNDTTTDNHSWIGAVYYKIIETHDSIGRNYYTLFGFDENTMRSSKKYLDVMTFDEDGQPVFGEYPYFSFEEDSAVKPPVNRYVIEFKKDAGPRLTFDDDMNMIVSEHLESEIGQPQKKWTLIPDGDYEGFTWKNRKWVHVEKIFHQVTQEGQEPVPNPIKNGGDLLHDKLSPETQKEQHDNPPPAANDIQPNPGSENTP